jgi:hypothetical protein
LQMLAEVSKSGCFSCYPDELLDIGAELQSRAAMLTSLGKFNSADQLAIKFREIYGMRQCTAPNAIDPSIATMGSGKMGTLADQAGGMSGPVTVVPAGRCSLIDAWDNARLNSGFGEMIRGVGPGQCEAACRNESACVGYDYNPSQSTCVIRAETVASAGLETISGWSHYECLN